MLSDRFRKSDLLALIGIVILVAWTPAYVAQDPDEREHADSRTFHLPPARIGDEAVLDLVVERMGHPTVRVPDVETMRFVEPTDDACPAETVLMHERHLRALNVTFGWGSVTRTELQYWMCYGDEGRAVWGGVKYASHSPATDHVRVEGVPDHETVRRDALVEASRTRIRHNPAPITALALDTVEDLMQEAGRNDVRTIHSFDILRHGGFALIGGQSYYSPDLPWEMEEQAAPRSIGPSTDTRYLSLDSVLLTLHEDFVVEGETTLRSLVDDDWPTPLGAYIGWGDSPPGLAMAIVPSHMERGDGPPHRVVSPAPIERTPTIRDPGHLLPWDPAPPEDGPQVRLGALSSLTDPLVRETSLATLHEVLMAEDGPPELQRFVQQGAVLTGFAWTAHPPLDYVLTPEDRPAPIALPELDQARTDTLLRTNWMLHYTDEDEGIGRFGLVEVNQTSQGTTYRTLTACVDEYHVTDWRGVLHCDVRLDKASIDPTRQVVHPASLVRRASGDDHRTQPPQEDVGNFVFMSAVRDDLRGAPVMWHGEDGRHTRDGMMRVPGGFASGGLFLFGTGIDRGGFAAWSEYDGSDGTPRERRSAAFALTDGARLSRLTAVSNSGSPAVPATAEPASAGIAPTMQELTPTSVAFAGLALILASLLLRSISGLKAGAHLPIVATLFSRISKDSALLHERRADIVALVEQEPGLTAKEIATRFGFAWGVTAHHLEKLASNGLVETAQNGQMRHYFTAGVPPRERMRIAMGRDLRYRSFLEAVDAAPGVALHEMVEALPQGKSGASRTGSRLERLGLVEKRREGRDVRYYPTPRS